MGGGGGVAGTRRRAGCGHAMAWRRTEERAERPCISIKTRVDACPHALAEVTALGLGGYQSRSPSERGGVPAMP